MPMCGQPAAAIPHFVDIVLNQLEVRVEPRQAYALRSRNVYEVFSMKITELQEVSTVDLYWICQVVDRIVNDPQPWLKNIEDIFGDAPSALLTRSFPKWTCLHVFIEECLQSIVWEQAGERMDVLHNGLWVDRLFAANGIDVSYEAFNYIEGPRSVSVYLEFITYEGHLEQLIEIVTKQVFHVLFNNRRTLSNFGNLVAGYVMNAAPSFAPESFTLHGALKRSRPPVWAREAAFHRDKGLCVRCRTDLTKIVNRNSSVHFDHIVPLNIGGMNCITNLQLLCENCNLSKGGSSALTTFDYESWYNYS